MERQTKTHKGRLKDASPWGLWAGCPAHPLRPLQEENTQQICLRVSVRKQIVGQCQCTLSEIPIELNGMHAMSLKFILIEERNM